VSDLFAIVAPVFALVALGALASRLGYLPLAVGEAVGRFAYLVALPALLFRTVAGSSFPSTIPWGYWAAYYGAVAASWAVAQTLARAAFGAQRRESVIVGLAAAQANIVLIGLPIILKAYGAEAAAPIALLVGINLPITLAVATLLFEAAGPRGAGPLAGAITKGVFAQPILLAILAGGAAALFGWRPTGAFDQTLALLAGAGIPCALVGLGATLVRHGVEGRIGLAGMASAVKLVLMPAVVFALGVAFALPPAYLGAAVLFAASPVGVNTFLFATRYETGVAFTSAAILLSTVASVVSTLFWLWMLGVG
jgi:hypothetical protein